jgi:hypothetical protein
MIAKVPQDVPVAKEMKQAIKNIKGIISAGWMVADARLAT